VAAGCQDSGLMKAYGQTKSPDLAVRALLVKWWVLSDSNTRPTD
jgi:hypothetical protein